MDLRKQSPLFALTELDYGTYVQNQKAKTSRKLIKGKTGAWVTEQTVQMLSDWLINRFGTEEIRGLCQGTRTGKETQWFLKHLNDRVSKVSCVGTEIDENARDIPNTIIHDFHEFKPEWEQKFDFVYSNSHDHALNPKEAFDTWLRFLRKGGVLLLEHSRSHGKRYADDIDVFGVETEFVPFLFLDWFPGKYCVTNMIPINNENAHVIFVIESLGSH